MPSTTTWDVIYEHPKLLNHWKKWYQANRIAASAVNLIFTARQVAVMPEVEPNVERKFLFSIAELAIYGYPLPGKVEQKYNMS